MQAARLCEVAQDRTPDRDAGELVPFLSGGLRPGGPPSPSLTGSQCPAPLPAGASGAWIQGFASPDPPSPSLAGPQCPAPLRPAPPAPGCLNPGASPRRTPHRRRSRGPNAPLRSGGRALRAPGYPGLRLPVTLLSPFACGDPYGPAPLRRGAPFARLVTFSWRASPRRTPHRRRSRGPDAPPAPAGAPCAPCFRASPRRTPHRRRSRGPNAPLRSGGRLRRLDRAASHRPPPPRSPSPISLARSVPGCRPCACREC